MMLDWGTDVVVVVSTTAYMRSLLCWTTRRRAALDFNFEIAMFDRYKSI